MKKILFLLLLPLYLIGQTKTENYILTKTYKVNSQSLITFPTLLQASQNISYFDGLGRPIQQVAHKQSSTGKDIVRHIEYDAFGRQSKEFLPFIPSNTPSLDIKQNEVSAFYGVNNITLTGNPNFEITSNPFSEKQFESSPLNRVLKQSAPGDAWALNSGHEIKIENGTNKASEVKRYDVELDANKNPKLIYNNFYEQSKLFKTTVRDENCKPIYYHEEWSPLDFKLSSNGYTNGTNVIFDINNNILKLYVDLSSSPWDNWKTGAIKTLLTKIDDVNLGNLIDTNTGIALYNLYIENNILYMQKIYNGSSLQSATFKTTLTTKVNDINSGTTEYKDFNDRIILKRSNNENLFLDTYYVYDIYGNLTYVLPAKASDLMNTSNLPSNIENNTVVSSATGLVLTASNSISLLPGFHAQSGSSFAANIITNNNQSTLDNLCYQYKYDDRNRLVEKKLPGKDWEYIVYDKLDRPILTQDANLRAQNKWLFTKYDVFSRPVYTGDYTNTVQTTREAIQELATATTTLFESRQANNTINGSVVYYSNNAFPNATNINLFTIQYYDDYAFDTNGGNSEVIYGITPTVQVKSLSTGGKTRILDTNNWITNVVYYDDKARPIYNYSKNDYLKTTDKVKMQLDFTGKVLESTTTHEKTDAIPSATTLIVDRYVYDHADRLLTHKQTINAQPEEVIAANTYDELGQLIAKGVGGKTTQNRLQTIDYSYNIRGWLKNINDLNAIGNDLFAFRLHYNDPTNTTTKLYNGNISQTFWKTASTDTSLKNYDYGYDALNRLTFAADNQSRYIENLTYDKNGNIMTLFRKGNIDVNATTFGTMDQLSYQYDSGNKLLKVQDAAGTEGFRDVNNAGDDYTYDNNGNMLTDVNKGITGITYNHLNLPTSIQLGGNSIYYVYDANGVKQQKDVINVLISSSASTFYAGSYVYQRETFRSPIRLQFLSQPEGYVTYNNDTFSYIYQYKDHLGNSRLSYSDSNNDGLATAAEIVEENNYYPFGMKHKGYNSIVNGIEHKYKYNGKELQDELGLNFYDYGARNYDPALGRWMNIDPLAEKMRRHSPYNYAFNNPIYFIDPDGMAPDDFVRRKDGSIYWDNNANSQATTKSSETYLGKTLTFSFNSYIDKKAWDGPSPPFVDPAGDKLTSSVTLKASENENGELTGLSASKSVMLGNTPVGKPRDFYPGEGGSNNVFNVKTTSTGTNINFEQHASVSSIEEVGLNIMGYKIVDVAQKLNISYNSKNGNLSVDAYTNVFPSATLKMNGSTIMQYNQPSFIRTHAAPYQSIPVSGGARAYNFSYYPSKFYKR